MKKRKILFKIGVIIFLIIFLSMVFLPFISQNVSAPTPSVSNDSSSSVISTETEKSE